MCRLSSILLSRRQSISACKAIVSGTLLHKVCHLPAIRALLTLMPCTEVQKLGPTARGMLYIELAKFPDHFLVLVVTDEDWGFALISVEMMQNTPCHDLVMKDIGWLDVRRIHGEEITVSQRSTAHAGDPAVGQKRKHEVVERPVEPPATDNLNYTPRCEFTFADIVCAGLTLRRYNLETQVLREVYAYCW